MRARTRRTSALAAGVVVIGFGALVWHRLTLTRTTTEAARPLPLVQITTPLQVDMQRKLLLTADILPIQQAELMAKIGGYLDAVYVDRGDRVHAGQLLAVIRQPELEQQLQQAQATYEFTKLTFERLQQLYGRNLVAKQELDDAHTKYQVARRLFEVQRATNEYAKIVAPFDGYVIKRYLDPGAYIPQASGFASNGNILLTVMDLTQVKVIVNLPERDVTSVHVGDPVSLTADAYPDQTFQGRVSKFAPALDASSRTLQLEIDIPNQDLALKPGMFARVTLVLERRSQALTVPAEALLVNELGSFLYVIASPEDGTPVVRRTTVRTGIEDGGQVEILAGLGAADQIVLKGKEFVHDGGRVRVAEDGTRVTPTAER